MRYSRLTRDEAVFMQTLADRTQQDVRNLKFDYHDLHDVIQELVAHRDIEIADQRYIITNQGWQSLADYDAHPAQF